MIPTLYEATATSFNDNGLGALPELYDVEVVEKANDLLELTATYPVSGRRYDDLIEDAIILAKPNSRDDEHAFRISDLELDIAGENVTITAYSITNDLGGNLITDLVISDADGQTAMTNLQNAVESETRFKFVSNITTKSSTHFKMVSPLEAIAGTTGSLLQIWGGEIKRENDQISLLARRGYDDVTTFRLGKNISGLKYAIDTSSVVTRIYPYYSKTVDGGTSLIRGATVDSKYIGNYPYIHIKPVDASQEITVTEDMTDKQIVAAIDGWAKDWFTKSANTSVDKPSVTISLDVLELSGSSELEGKLATLEQLGLFDTVTLFVPEYKIDVTAKVNELHYDPMAGRVTSLVAGTVKTSVFSQQSNALSIVQAAVAEAKNQADYAAVSANGKNTNFYGDAEPFNPKEGDIWYTTELIDGKKEDVIKTFTNGVWTELVISATGRQIAHDVDAKMEQLNADMSTANSNLQVAKQDVADLQVNLKANDDTQAQLSKDLSANSTILEQAKADIVTNTQALSDLDTKLKANDDAQAQLQDDLAANTKVQDQLKKDLSDNTKLIAANKESVDAALVTVNKTLTQAQADASSAAQKADDAVGNAKSAVEASELATQTANAASDAATAAKNLATSTANSFATVQSQAATAANDAATALDQAKSALDTANGVSDNYTSLKTIVDDTSGTIKTLATSASVDAVSGRVTKAQSLAEQTANGLTLKADNSVVDTLSDTVKQQGIDIKAAQGELSAKLTQSDLTKGLDGYATQNWAQQQITASATGLETKLSTVTSGLGVKNYIYNSEFAGDSEGWTKATSGFSTQSGFLGSTNKYKGSNGVAFKATSVDATSWSWLKSKLVPTKSGESWSASAVMFAPKAYASDATVKVTQKAYIEIDFLSSDKITILSSKTSNVFDLTDQFTPQLLKVEGFTCPPNGAYVYVTLVLLGPGYPIFAQPMLSNTATVGAYQKDAVDTSTFDDLVITVNGLSNTTAKQTALQTVSNKLDVTATGLTNVTTVIGAKGEQVTALRSDVNAIQTTMSGFGQLTTDVQTLQGFQKSASSDITGLQTTQTLLSNQWTSAIGSPNLIYNSSFVNNLAGWSNKGGSSYSNGGWAGEAVGIDGIMVQSESAGWYGAESKKVPASENAVYSGSVKICVANWTYTPAAAYLEIVFFDSSGARITAYDVYADTSEEKWRYVKKENLSAPKGTKFVSIILVMHDAGKVKFEQPILVQGESVGPYRPDVVSGSQITQLQDDINLRVTKDGIISQINLAAGKTLIQNNTIMLDASTVTMGGTAFINAANIKSVNADTITSGSISADRLATTKLNADNITSGSISAARIASTAINADNITSGTIAAARIATTALSATNITSGTFDASKMTVKNIDAGSITSGSIATALLASTKINADNITSGSIAADRIATTALSATNIVSGTLDVGKLTVKNLSADMIASGTIDASKITVKNLSASNIIGGELDAGLVNVKNINASNIITGTLNAGLLNVIGLNASAITTGTITGANLAINLNSGEVLFTKGSIKSTTGTLDIEIEDGTFSQRNSSGAGFLMSQGNLYFSATSFWGALDKNEYALSTLIPDYGYLGFGDMIATKRGMALYGKDSLSLGLIDTSLSVDYFDNAQGFISIKKDDSMTVHGGGKGLILVGGTTKTGTTMPTSPSILVGSNASGDGGGNRIYIDAEYFHVPTVYTHTTSGSANVIVNSDGALVRTSSATKYKTNINRFNSTDMAEKLLSLPQAHWYNKQDMQRYVDDPEHYSMPELDYGMIAEDLAAAGLEDLVVRGDDGELEDIRYDRIGPALLPLLAKMKQEIEELKSAAKSA